MSIILLSIKPEYSRQIFSGRKKYEFRRRLAKQPVTKIVVYASSPVKAVVGEADVIGTIAMKPSLLWERVKEQAGISETEFQVYFTGCKKAYAYQLGKVTPYDVPVALSAYHLSHAPQSFVYLEKE